MFTARHSDWWQCHHSRRQESQPGNRVVTVLSTRNPFKLGQKALESTAHTTGHMDACTSVHDNRGVVMSIDLLAATASLYDHHLKPRPITPPSMMMVLSFSVFRLNDPAPGMASPEPPAIRMRRRNHQRSRSPRPPCTGLLCASLNLTRPAQCPYHPHERTLSLDDLHYDAPMRQPPRRAASWEMQSHARGRRKPDVALFRDIWVIEEADEWEEKL